MTVAQDRGEDFGWRHAYLDTGYWDKTTIARFKRPKGYCFLCDFLYVVFSPKNGGPIAISRD